MNVILIIFLLFILSCSYPDIDTVPKFNFNKTFQEKCSVEAQTNIENEEECEIIKIFTRL